MSPKLFSNLGLKFLALIFGALIWLVVLNVDDYSTTKRITDIPVELINTESITDQSQIFNVTSGETVDIIVKGRRSIVNGLSASSFTATADMSKISITNAVTITVTANSSTVSSAVAITIVDNTLLVDMEELKSVSVPVTVVTSGSPESGYTVGTAVVTPNLVTVEGAASIIDRIDRIELTVDVSGKSADVTTECTPVFCDIYGEEISASKVSCDVESISVTVPIYETKEINIDVSTTGTPAANFEVTNVEYGPVSITVGGPTDVLKTFDSITIDDIDVTELTENLETTVDLTPYLPTDVVIAGDNTSVNVQVTIERHISRTISITSSDVKLENTLEDYDYDITFGDTAGTIVVSGLSDNVAGLTASALGIVVDASTLVEGTNEVTLDIEDGDVYTVDSECTVTIEVTPMP